MGLQTQREQITSWSDEVREFSFVKWENVGYFEQLDFYKIE